MVRITITAIPRDIYGGNPSKRFYEIRRNGVHIADTTSKKEANLIRNRIKKRLK